ncbi:immunoglobulin binding protein Tap42 isoform X2 [Rhodnius prolixus]
MRLLEDATRLTSIAGVFSTNEAVEEVETENLRLFLLPALLGMLTLKITSNTNRIEIVETSDTYFRDFLQRCNDYGLSKVIIPPPVEIDEEKIANAVNRPHACNFDIMSAARNRATKIQRYKEEKALEEQLKDLSEAVKSPTVDEDTKREYFMKLIKLYVAKAEEELDCLQSEKLILAHMKSVGKNDTLVGAEETKRRIKPPKPLTPVIITKDELQKAVFGAGYPSLPTMTVQEFYDKRVKEGIFPEPSKGSINLQDLASQGSSRQIEEDKEKEENEILEEQDDSELLARRRAMDEYKDDHKRGWGNRYNRS